MTCLFSTLILTRDNPSLLKLKAVILVHCYESGVTTNNLYTEGLHLTLQITQHGANPSTGLQKMCMYDIFNKFKNFYRKKKSMQIPLLNHVSGVKALWSIETNSIYGISVRVGIATNSLLGNIFLLSRNLQNAMCNSKKDYLFYMDEAFYYIETYLVTKAFLKTQREQDKATENKAATTFTSLYPGFSLCTYSQPAHLLTAFSLCLSSVHQDALVSQSDGRELPLAAIQPHGTNWELIQKVPLPAMPHKYMTALGCVCTTQPHLQMTRAVKPKSTNTLFLKLNFTMLSALWHVGSSSCMCYIQAPHHHNSSLVNGLFFYFGLAFILTFALFTRSPVRSKHSTASSKGFSGTALHTLVSPGRSNRFFHLSISLSHTSFTAEWSSSFSVTFEQITEILN